jgi:glyceraldehyde-3-phosphate dehydrogenase/erythrose-4-phosphate dehydrogenase
MSIEVALNGLGRIGRAILKWVIDEPSLELVPATASATLIYCTTSHFGAVRTSVVRTSRCEGADG